MKKSKTFRTGILYAVFALFLVGGMVNCGGGSGSSSAQVQVPKLLIQDFIAKHSTMVDTGLVDLYVTEEHNTVAAAVQKTIAEKQAAGELENLQQATFDFSGTQITLVDQKEAYVHDEPTQVIKVSVTGSYTMKLKNNTVTIPADETIILEMVKNGWKVTEKTNPWSKYVYKNKG